MKLTVKLTDSEADLLKQAADRYHTHPSTVAKEILSVWFADRRAERRYQVEPNHYTDRNGSDFEELP